MNVPYIEERHAPLFHRLAKGRVGVSSVPALIVEGKAFTDSTEILKYLDTIAPDEATSVFGRGSLQRI